jgi:ribosome biogenesis GTPase
VTALLERDSVLQRATFSGEEKPLAANITQMVIVLAPQPEPSEYLVDQYLVAAEKIGLDVIITINKSDLLTAEQKQQLHQRFAGYEAIGYQLVFISSRLEQGLTPLTDLLKQQTSILVGQSGVGKSSLTNALIPDLDLQTRKLSDRKQSGQHTTSASTLYHLPAGGNLIDSPGVRSFRLGQVDIATLENGFRDLRAYFGHCRFSNCSHTSEPGCALLEAIEQGRINPQRLENFLHLKKELNGS